MLDLHNHVLYGLDDGCRTPDESRELARRAKRAGHEGFVATPHIRPGMFDNTPDDLRRRRDEAAHLVEEEGLELFLGAEYHLTPELLEAAKARRVLTVGETTRFVLVELPTRHLPPRWDEVLYEIRVAGYAPIIAHPERCEGVARDLELACEVFRRQELLLQLDLGSLIGHYGPIAKKAAKRLAKRDVYHVAACDLHRPEDVEAIVAPSLKALRKVAGRKEADDRVERLTRTNPRLVLADAGLDRFG